MNQARLDGTTPAVARASSGSMAQVICAENTLTGNTRFQPGQGEAAVTGQCRRQTSIR